MSAITDQLDKIPWPAFVGQQVAVKTDAAIVYHGKLKSIDDEKAVIEVRGPIFHEVARSHIQRITPLLFDQGRK